ncbi:MAG: hypothetical protein C0391_09725 [Anaerolinea sp.]|nr:hypothetical protein [Anaerolinea sp.]
MVKLSTSQRILNYLRTHPPISSADLAGALLLTKADIRYHLSHLFRVGAVSRVIKHLHPAAGRPCYYYTSLQVGTELPYRNLARSLVACLLIDSDPVEQQQRVLRVANHMMAGFNNVSSAGSQQMQTVVQYLSSLGYKARWEARTPHPVIQLCHCPYLELAVEYPVLCQLDLQLIMGLSNLPCIQLETIKDNPRQIQYCSFQVLI